MVATRRRDYGEPGGSDTAKQTTCPIPTFTLFPKLPPELRIEVWKMSMTPRLVVVKPTWDRFGSKPEGRTTYSKKILLVHFAINCEARECALRHYNLRFTITATADAAPRRGDYESMRCHANVVMSSDDTLGFLGWGGIVGRPWKFQVESVAWGGVWVNNRPSTCGEPVDVKKVAYLTTELGQRSRIIQVFNSKVSWNVDSIIHTKPTKRRRLYALGGTHYAKDCITMHSRNFSGTLQEWAKRLSYRFQHGGMNLYGPAMPDIMAFELGKEPEEAPEPANGLENWRSDSDCDEDDYFWREWKWLQNHPSPQGF